MIKKIDSNNKRYYQPMKQMYIHNQVDTSNI